MGVHLLTFQITDGYGLTKSVVIPMADTEAIADIQTFVTNHAPHLDEVIGGVITKASVQYALTLPGGLDSVAENDHPVKHGGLFAFSVTGSAYRKSIYVPTVLHTLIAEGGNIANSGFTAAWITDLLSGTEISPTNNHEQVLASFLSGKQVDRK